MKLLLPIDVQEVIVRELHSAGKRECGGILFGEHLSDDLFQIVGITRQKSRGTISHFVRDPTQHAEQLDMFFRDHHEDCSRFNYLGEWHSHPSFEVLPSKSDLLSMSELVSDPSVGANFAVLLIVRLSRSRDLQASATLCQPPEQFSHPRLYIESSRPVAKRRLRFL